MQAKKQQQLKAYKDVIGVWCQFESIREVYNIINLIFNNLLIYYNFNRKFRFILYITNQLNF